MKSIKDVKKLVVAGLGAALMAASVAVAPLHYQNTEIVDANGQPVAKVVVGHNAAASDGVAAAYIATVIANRAYKERTVTAEIQGTPTCTVSGQGNGEGQCPVLDESVTLKFTTPGQAGPGEYYFSTYIADHIDKETKNRKTDNYDKYTDVTHEDANPFQDQLGGTFFNPDFENPGGEGHGADYIETLLGAKNELFPSYAATSGRGSGTWIEQEGLWIAGETVWKSDDGVRAHVPYVTYVIDFEPSEKDKGLSLCPGDDDLSYEECGTNDRIEAKQVYIKFLGKRYVVSDVSIPNEDTDIVKDEEIYQIPNSYIKLAEEAGYAHLNVDESLNVTYNGGKYVITLTDLSQQETCDNANLHPAVFEIKKVDAAGNVLETQYKKVCPGSTQKVDFNSGGEIKIHVYESAAGTLLNAKWADVAIFSNEIELKDGDKFEDSDWKVALGWMGDKNEDRDQAKYLKKIVLYRDGKYDDDYSDEGYMTAGSYRTVVDNKDEANWKYGVYKVQYLGLTNPDDWKVSFELDTWSNKTVYYGNDKCWIAGEYVKIALDGDVKYDMELWDGGSTDGDEAYYVYNATATNCPGPNFDGNAYIFIKNPDDGHYEAIADNSGSSEIVLETEEDELSVFIAGVHSDKFNTSDTDEILVGVADKAGKWEDTDAVEVIGRVIKLQPGDDKFGMPDSTGTYDDEKFAWGFYDGTDDTTRVFTGTYINLENNILNDYTTAAVGGEWDTDNEKSQYDKDDDFVSFRGDVVSNVDENSFKVTVPKTIVEAQYKVIDTTVNGSSGENGITRVMKEGDKYTIPGTEVTVEVVSIDETLGSCSVGDGGTPVCEPNMENVQAVISPYGTSQATVVEPYQISSPLVVMDSDVIGNLDVENVISVGGPVVNEVTNQLLQGTDYQLDANNPVLVAEVAPNKIVVAGYEAEDTMQAAQQFVQELTSS